MNKFIKKWWKVGAYGAGYIADLVALTYLGLKDKEAYDNGELSAFAYSAKSTATLIGGLAVGYPIITKGLGAWEDAYWQGDEE